nr:CHAP domain-containing protein [Brevibacterium sp. 68QC2CO]
MSAITEIRKVHEGQNGYHETPFGSNLTKYGKWYPMNGVAWCAIYASWVMHQAGVPTSVVPKHAYTPSGAAWFKARGQWHHSPKVGDMVYYDLAGLGRISHVGWVSKVYKDGSWDAWEGNTDKAGGRTGGRVMLKHRSSTGPRGGFGRPKYPKTSTSTASSSSSSGGVLGLTLKNVGKRTKDVPLPKSKWATLPINDKNDASMASGLKKGQDLMGHVTLTAEGLPAGKEIAVRFILVEYKKGVKTKTRYIYPSEEIIGTAGKTFGKSTVWDHLGVAPAKGKDMRLRVQALAHVSGVKIIDATYKVGV